MEQLLQLAAAAVDRVVRAYWSFVADIGQLVIRFAPRTDLEPPRKSIQQQTWQ